MKRIYLLILLILLTSFLFISCSTSTNKPAYLIYHGEVSKVEKLKESWTLKDYVPVVTPKGNVILPNYPTLLIFNEYGIAQLPYIQWIDKDKYYEPNTPIVGEYWIYRIEKDGSGDYYIFSPREILNWDNNKAFP